MYFTSYEFIGFLTITVLLYYVVPKKAQWVMLLVMSLLFYAINGPKNVIFIAFSCVTAYFSALFIESKTKHQKKIKNDLSLPKEEKDKIKAHDKKIKNIVLFVTVVLNVSVLVAVKESNILTVLGISYYTLRTIGYIVDVARGDVTAEQNFLKLLLYLSFFPVVIQGPITDYGRLTESLYAEHRFSIENFETGLIRVLFGFFKKLAIADRAYTGVAAIVENPDTYNGAWVLVGMLLYTIELYADFTGGIDITIGISEMLGVTVQENFNRPFFAVSLKDYWRRWHISMSEWFKTYVFYPISGSRLMRKALKSSKKHFGEKIGKKVPVFVASGFVWAITGLWHGIKLNYVTWAMLHFLILMVSEILEPAYAKFHKKFKFSNTFPYRIFMSIRTVFIVSVLMQFDIFTSVPVYFLRLVSVFTIGKWGEVMQGGFIELGLTTSDIIIILAGCVILFTLSILKGDGDRIKEWLQSHTLARPLICMAIFVCVILFSKYGAGYDAGQFIYTRF